MNLGAGAGQTWAQTLTLSLRMGDVRQITYLVFLDLCFFCKMGVLVVPT